MSLSSGSPGLILLRMPSSIAISIALNAKYGLPLPSGRRYSIRFDAGPGECTGMRIAAERLRRGGGRVDGGPETRAGRWEVVGRGVGEAADAGEWRRGAPE